MTSFTLVMICAASGSEASAPTTDFALNLRLASTTTHAPLSPQWAMSYYQTPRLIGTPAPVDEPSNVSQEVPPEMAVIPPDAAADGELDLIWHDWSMSDMSLEWGLATIGPGVLAPQTGGVGGRPGGGGPGGGGQQRPQAPTFLFAPPTPANPTPIPTPGPNVEPVPEASAVFLWLMLFSALVLGVNRWNKPPAIAASLCPA
jgi:hypothetical protein